MRVSAFPLAKLTFIDMFPEVFYKLCPIANVCMVNQVFLFLHDVCFKTVIVERCSCQDVYKFFALPKKDGLRLCQIDNNNDNEIDQCIQIIRWFHVHNGLLAKQVYS